MVSELIQHVRDLLALPGVSKSGLALEAGLSKNALRDADRDDWNPNAKTLEALETMIARRKLAATRAFSVAEPVLSSGNDDRFAGEAVA